MFKASEHSYLVPSPKQIRTRCSVFELPQLTHVRSAKQRGSREDARYLATRFQQAPWEPMALLRDLEQVTCSCLAAFISQSGAVMHLTLPVLVKRSRTSGKTRPRRPSAPSKTSSARAAFTAAENFTVTKVGRCATMPTLAVNSYSGKGNSRLLLPAPKQGTTERPSPTGAVGEGHGALSPPSAPARRSGTRSCRAALRHVSPRPAGGCSG